MDIKNQKWLEIFLWYTCNIKCDFCYQKDLRFEYTKNISKEEVELLIQNWKKQWKQFIIFSGWEPTLDKNLPYYIAYANSLWYEHIRVHTNGFGFRNYEYLEDLNKEGLTGVTISVHGFWKVHDIITKVDGSFSIIVQSLVNFQKLKKKDSSFVIDTNTVICKKNYKNIPQLIKFLSYFSITRWQIVLSYSLGLFTISEKKLLIPKYNEIVPYLEQCIDVAVIKKRKFVLENVPFCVISKEYWSSILENIKIQKDSITLKDGNLGITNSHWMENSKKCVDCSMKGTCRGIPEDYKELYGDDCITTLYD